jgi:hypothetical protein
LLKDRHTVTAALIAVMRKNLRDDVRTRTLDVVRNGTGKVELRTPAHFSMISFRASDRAELWHNGAIASCATAC